MLGQSLRAVTRLVPLAALVLAGCAARKLDDLTSSYERLAAQATEAQSTRAKDRPARLPRQSVGPPTGSLAPAFLVVGRDALDATSGRNMDPRTRVALYRVAASSAHFVLVEEAATGRPVTVAPDTAARSATAGDTAASGATIMLRSVREAAPLCDGLQANRPPRDCTYLGMAASLANLAVVSEPWLFLPQANAANLAQHAEAFSRSPDDAFEAAWVAYQRDSGLALQKLGAAAGQAVPAGVAVSGPGGYVRRSDARAFCVLATRALKVNAISPTTAVPGVDANRNRSLLVAARSWYSTRYNAPEPDCEA